MKQRLYLDTSIFSMLVDDRAPERQALTLDFWKRRAIFELATSEIARVEILRTVDDRRREAMLLHLDDATIHQVDQPTRDLAASYIREAIFTINSRNDALHVAAAVLTRQDALLSWNFRHLVNRQRRALINAVNLSAGLPTIDIIAPPEV